ncbi:MAG: type II toxin-antitoxin system RelE/ParE family toxin [Salinisphaera sp.]|nr:type II toxin-antitoxin system RelE/ParE family toxin [Salinisphaera sp.]
MYRLSRLAADDFAAIYEYTLLNFGAGQADAYTNDLENVLRLLASHPAMGRECPEITDTIRRHDHHRHAIFYRQQSAGIFIIRILHQRMEPLKHFDSL